MTRIDIPTLKCDWCGDTTTDKKAMIKYRKLTHSHMSGCDEWDLCPMCWAAYLVLCSATEVLT